METSKIKYVAYYRVSTKRQGESGLGLEAQKTIVEHYFNESEIVATYTENRTAKSMKNRYELQKALQYCKLNGYTLVVAKLDRLTRSMIDFETIYLALNGCVFSCDTSTKGTQTDKAYFQMKMMFAEKERELISIRTKQALTELKKRGVILGYDRPEVRVGIENSDKLKNSQIGKFQTSEANENINTLQVNEKIISLKNNGATYTEIAKELNKRNAKGELINKYPNYGKVKNNKIINSDWQTIQVQRIYEKYKKSE